MVRECTFWAAKSSKLSDHGPPTNRSDAFTAKQISQLSIAYEKASVIFNIASTLSSLASSQHRSSAEGFTRAIRFFRSAAGMFSYINDNFLHAPSTDLSRDVVKILVTLMLSQATEVVYEKLVDEKKGAALKSRVASQVAFLYTGIIEEVKEFMAKNVFERAWCTLLQVSFRGQALAAIISVHL